MKKNKNHTLDNGTRKFLLKTAVQIIYRCTEYTPPEIKFSDHNKSMGNAVCQLEDIIKTLSPKPNQQ